MSFNNETPRLLGGHRLVELSNLNARKQACVARKQGVWHSVFSQCLLARSSRSRRQKTIWIFFFVLNPTISQCKFELLIKRSRPFAGPDSGFAVALLARRLLAAAENACKRPKPSRTRL